MPLVFNEDTALKARLTGLNISAANGTLPVKAWFGLPQQELRDLTFPAIVIEHTSVERDPEREHRGYTTLDYAPEGKAIWWTAGAADYDPTLSPYKMEFPVPMNIDYEVTVLAREKTHLMQLVAMLTADDRIPPRFGALYIPQDRTARRLEVLAGADVEAARDQDGKRIFRAKYALRVPTEIVPADYPTMFRVATVKTNLYTPLKVPVTP